MYQTLEPADIDRLRKDFLDVRKISMRLFKPLRIEDAVMQSDTFGSPANWHISHVTWFFQKILEKYKSESLFFEESVNLEYLNSYYQKYESILPKSQRGMFPRPTVSESMKYRNIIEDMVLSFLTDIEKSSHIPEELIYDFELANQHEMQHQELMAYDFQHYFERFSDPSDRYEPLEIKRPQETPSHRPSGMAKIPGGIYRLGYSGNTFCYDNELPEHNVYLEPFEIDVTPVTNGDFVGFIESGGYQDYSLWLADGWELLKEQNWQAPLYWRKESDIWVKKDLRRSSALESDEPVTNISYYEADAYARWAKKRLPTEAEWEKAACWNEKCKRKSIYPWGDDQPTSRYANLLESFTWGPSKVGSYPEGKSHYGCHQMIGDVWEWTSSEYVLYPKFKSKFAEYTDKWSVNQKVLRGGSFSTPRKQIRCSYRNYFKPHERIPFTGLRCVSDI